MQHSMNDLIKAEMPKEPPPSLTLPIESVKGLKTPTLGQKVSLKVTGTVRHLSQNSHPGERPLLPRMGLELSEFSIL